MALKSQSQSKARKAILKYATDLGVVVDELIWEPIRRGGEMQGPLGGWELSGRAFRRSIQAIGYSVGELMSDLICERCRVEMDRQLERARRDGLESAATEKDAEIERLRAMVAFGGSPEQERNRWLALKLRELDLAVRAAHNGNPPLRDEWMRQEIIKLALGEHWERGSFQFTPPQHPVKFTRIPQEQLKRFIDQSPWTDLHAIRQAAGTQDTHKIVTLVTSARSKGDDPAQVNG